MKMNTPVWRGMAQTGVFNSIKICVITHVFQRLMRLRYVIIQMALDIEHFAKVKLLQALENSSEVQP